MSETPVPPAAHGSQAEGGALPEVRAVAGTAAGRGAAGGRQGGGGWQAGGATTAGGGGDLAGDAPPGASPALPCAALLPGGGERTEWPRGDGPAEAGDCLRRAGDRLH